MSDKYLKPKDSFHDLWQILLVRGPEQIRSQLPQGTFNDIPGHILNIVTALDKTDTLETFLYDDKINKGSPRGWEALFLGLGWLAMGSTDKGIKLVGTASMTPSCRAQALVSLVSHYLGKNQIGKADALIREGLSLDKQIGQFHLQNARILLMDRAHDKVTQELTIAQEKGCFSLLDRTRIELELLVSQDKQAQAIKKAISLLQKGIKGVGNKEVAGVGLGILIGCGALDEADNYLDQSLEEDQDNIFLLTHRADIASLTGRFRMAGACVARALHQDKENISLLTRIARLAGQAFSHDQGLAALKQIMELSQSHPFAEQANYLAQYGDIYADQEDLEQAITAYEKALKIEQNCIPALAGLSQVMVTLGRLDEARALQDRIYEIAPVRALQFMIDGNRIPGDDVQIKRMLSMAQNPSTPLPMRASLNLSLAKMYQGQENHLHAMPHADKANEIFSSFISYGYKQQAKQVDKIMACMSNDFFSSRKEFGSSCELPIFILGMPRSGTTLVEQILGGHSLIFPGGELGMIPQMWRRLVAWEYRLGSGLDNIPDAVLDLTRDQSMAFADKVKIEYQDLMPKDTNVKHFTDKLPHNFKNIGLIKLLYPNAKIIYCRRKAGGIALSNYFTDYKARHGGMGFAYNQEWIGYEIANCHRLMAHWINIFANDIHVVDYETLVESPGPVVKEMFDYLKLGWEEKVLEFHTLDRPVKTASVTQVRQPLYKGSKDRWRCYENQLKPMFDALARRKANKAPEPLALPDHDPGLFVKGMDLLTAGKYGPAENQFSQIIEVNPGHAAAIHMLGASFFHQGLITPARKCMEHSIRLHQGNPTWYENLAVLLEHAGQKEEAEKHRRQSRNISRQPHYIPKTVME